MEMMDENTIQEAKRRQILARAIQFAMDLRCDMLGAALTLSYDTNGNIDFRMGVTETGINEPELHALGEMLEMTDAAGIPINSKLTGNFLYLLPFYQDFGFRIADEHNYKNEINASTKAAERVKAHLDQGHCTEEILFTMHRKPWSSALISQTEIDKITNKTSPAKTPLHEHARQRDAILIALQKRGLTANQAGYRISPNMTDVEVCIRNSERRKQGWNVPKFSKKPIAKINANV